MRSRSRQALAGVAAALALVTMVTWHVGRPADAAEPPIDVVYIARAYELTDALAGSVAASLSNAPILLVPGGADNRIPEAVRRELTRLEPRSIIIFGGPAAVSPAVQDQLQQLTSGAVTRVLGATRIETGEAIPNVLPTK